jgi:hypothetical protein
MREDQHIQTMAATRVSRLKMPAADGDFGSPSEEVTARITIESPEVYQICVRGTDVADNTGESECIFLAVYDPDGGFVTGGGWIWSEPGAYTADPTCEGKANFGRSGVQIPAVTPGKSRT